MTTIYLAHSIHTGVEFEYRYAAAVDQALVDSLPFTYGISSVSADGEQRGVLATVIVKSDLGQSRDEVHAMYTGVEAGFPDLAALPHAPLTMRCTRSKLPPGTVFSEEFLVQMLRDVYAVNGVGGSA